MSILRPLYLGVTNYDPVCVAETARRCKDVSRVSRDENIDAPVCLVLVHALLPTVNTRADPKLTRFPLFFYIYIILIVKKRLKNYRQAGPALQANFAYV